jgi:hypothetical protein
VDKSATGIASEKALAPAATIQWSDQAAAAGVVSWRCPVATTARRSAGQGCCNFSAVATSASSQMSQALPVRITGIALLCTGRTTSLGAVVRKAKRRCSPVSPLRVPVQGRQMPAKANGSRSPFSANQCGIFGWLAAVRHLFDWLVTGQVIPVNPARSVRGPSHTVTIGKTPVLAPEEARALIDSIEVTTIVGLRDRALIALMVFSARIGAALGMKLEDVYTQNRRLWVRLREKRRQGARHAVSPQP